MLAFLNGGKVSWNPHVRCPVRSPHLVRFPDSKSKTKTVTLSLASWSYLLGKLSLTCWLTTLRAIVQLGLFACSAHPLMAQSHLSFPV